MNYSIFNTFHQGSPPQTPLQKTEAYGSEQLDALLNNMDIGWSRADSGGFLNTIVRFYRMVVPLRNATTRDEVVAEEFFDALEEDVLLNCGALDGTADMIVEDGTTHVIAPTPGGEEECPIGDGVKLKFARLSRVRRSHGRKFVAKWVAWGKAEFPAAYRSISMADRTCIEMRLCKEMRKERIWDRDIVRYKSRIVIGIMMPSIEEAEEERFWATTAAGDRKRLGRPLGRSWFGWLTGRGGVTWQK